MREEKLAGTDPSWDILLLATSQHSSSEDVGMNLIMFKIVWSLILQRN
jgi:hypothetical protein